MTTSEPGSNVEEPRTVTVHGRASALAQEITVGRHRLERSTHFEILEVPVTASPTEVGAAYIRLARLYRPHAQHDPALVNLHDHLEKIFARLNAAHDVLSHPSSRASYEASLARRWAERALAELEAVVDK